MAEEYEIRGVAAQIYWVYHVAASVQGYTVRITKKTGCGTVRATLASSDAFRLAQSPLVFAALLGKGMKKWAMSSIAINHGTVTATLAPFKETV